MSTASTKSDKQRVGGEKGSAVRKNNSGQVIDPPAGIEISQSTWFLLSAVILFVGAFLRLYDLNLVPLHHDEGVNGNFLIHLVRDGYYHYDPANYHGPTLYYFAALFPWLVRRFFGPEVQDHYGLTTVAIRCVPALFGLGTIALVFFLRRNLGTIATLTAAFLLAISPGAVYLSRYFIHETLFVFFTLGIVVASLKYYESASPVYLVLGALSAALLFATKETALISVAVLLIALIVTPAYRWLWVYFSGQAKKKKKTNYSGDGGAFSAFVEKAGGPARLAIWLLIAVVVFDAVYVLFYSSFTTNYPQGVYDSLKTFQFWTKTGKEAHVHPFATYVWWLLEQESPLLVLGAMGAALAFLRPVKSFALFAALWAFGLIAAYSLIAYKTPWLSLNFVVPLALCSGVTCEWLYEELGKWEVSKPMRAAVIAGVLLVAIGPLPGLTRIFDEAVAVNPWPGLAPAFAQTEAHGKTFVPGYQTIDLNFINYDNDNRYYVYVYAHTRRETLKMLAEIDRIAERTHQDSATGISIVSPDYWPLPWYLRDYTRVGYHGHMTTSNEPIIIARQDQAAEVEATFGDRYQLVHSGVNTAGSFSLRPGVDLLLYTRRELVR
ncbi:MAG TPA: flippase activity-associated protein Agl23 [Pyrinomonadaceae bacterium]|nr:flippase activity-associated protein Agl23 [Pyrinomonadaceae bacterium]